MGQKREVRKSERDQERKRIRMRLWQGREGHRRTERHEERESKGWPNKARPARRTICLLR